MPAASILVVDDEALSRVSLRARLAQEGQQLASDLDCILPDVCLPAIVPEGQHIAQELGITSGREPVRWPRTRASTAVWSSTRCERESAVSDVTPHREGRGVLLLTEATTTEAPETKPEREPVEAGV